MKVSHNRVALKPGSSLMFACLRVSFIGCSSPGGGATAKAANQKRWRYLCNYFGPSCILTGGFDLKKRKGFFKGGKGTKF